MSNIDLYALALKNFVHENINFLRKRQLRFLGAFKKLIKLKHPKFISNATRKKIKGRKR